MKVKLRQQLITQGKMHDAGEELEVDDAVARTWISHGLAVALEDVDIGSVGTYESAPEAAAKEPPETTTKPKARKRK